MARTLVTVIEGIKNKVGIETEIKYAKGCDIWDDSKDGYQEAIELAKNSEVAIVVVGDRGGMFQEGITSGEHVDRTEITLFGV